MYKFVILFAMVACITAVPAPKPEPGYIAAPVVAAASPITLTHTAPVATSYANTYKVSYKSPVIAAAPLVATAPAVAFAASAPVVTHHTIAAAPLTYTAHHAPIIAIH
ncbi:hypothetical protein PV327_008077 [Microctonus hyperodae]|uniref:Uncharacterized protein n=1 Tax=Microctonus hyperodae TaxID=165561 RepID=A0AA39F2C8_MICHY|nr:hypothetical protein PV327_008077 [Microctonus hyperodae]